jgi:type VI secretion system secreted protein VgrG
MPNSLTKTATISIGDTAITAFRSLRIVQSVHTYHEFELEFSDDATSPKFPFAFGDSHPLLGKKISITIEGELSSMAKLEFDGVVAEAESALSELELPSVLVRGYGQPYSLDVGAGTSVFAEQTAVDIITACLGSYSGSKQIGSVTGPTHKLPYCVRYRETLWNFMRRLAYSYGAWLYYDGKKLHFTSTPGQAGSPVALQMGITLDYLRSGTRAVAQKVAYSDYFSLDNAPGTGEAGTNPALFATVAGNDLPGPQRAVAVGDIKSFATNQSASLAAQVGYVTGRSDVPGLSIGTTISIDTAPGGGSSLGNFTIIEVTHVLTEALIYHCQFTAVPAAVKAMPPGPLHYPVSEAQVGTVLDNKDPKNIGRVQVKLAWMSGSEKTPWLRVLAPHYGQGKQDKSRGFQFVPEKDDQVMVGFQHGDPERPFVFGAMPHGKNAAVPKPSAEAHLSVTSGSTVSFLDSESAHELHVQVDDKNLMTIVVNSGQGTITINASKNILLKATQEITLDAPTINLKGQNVAIKGAVKVDIAGAQVGIKADAELKAEGTTTKVAGTVTANFESSGVVTVKGAMVMIN